jgi:hypothetical protein
LLTNTVCCKKTGGCEGFAAAVYFGSSFGGYLDRRVLFALVVEAEVDGEVLGHDVGTVGEIHQRRKILVAP